MTKYKQLILFGSPGTGKSHTVATEMLEELGAEKSYIRTVFHPDYSYGDFMGKLMPLTKKDRVTYSFYPGHFLKALAKAYKHILDAPNPEEAQHVVLIIDEINRGNSAAIFGTAFQLLDRVKDDTGDLDRGWSEYPVEVSDMEFDELLDMVGIEKTGTGKEAGRTVGAYQIGGKGRSYIGSELNEVLEPLKIEINQLRIPPNLSLIATMNTSDNSIYYMDSAFKRRWNWQFVDVTGKHVQASGFAFESRPDWESFVRKLNAFIKSKHEYIRKVEDKQIGYWFITGDSFTKAQIQNKVMFFLWDSVFATHRKPLADLLGLETRDLVTFGDFARKVDAFIEAVNLLEEEGAEVHV